MAVATAGAARRRQSFKIFGFVAPSLLVSVAYIDPGNFATNLAAGSSTGYRLLWVVVVASAIAMLFQALSSKLGLVTGKSLATHVRERFDGRTVFVVWIAGEVAAMATELAEVLGAALALHLLFGMSLLAGALVTFAIVSLVMNVRSRGFRTHEAIAIGMVAIVAIAYVAETVWAAPSWGEVARASVVPWIDGRNGVALAVAIVGATVMPHVLYYHSTLTRERAGGRAWSEIKQAVRRSNAGVFFALAAAGIVNMAMVYVSAATFHAHGHGGITDLGQAYRELLPILGRDAALLFGVALLASGLASSIVGTAAGQTIVQDLTRFRIPAVVRRVLTMLPALAVVALGVNVTATLVATQVVLSFVLPIPLVALVYFTSRRATMGTFVNSPVVTALAVFGTLVIVTLNVALLVRSAG